MTPKNLKCLLFLGLAGVAVHAAGPKSPSHEEEVVRSTYAALSFQCSLKPIAKAAMERDQDFVNEQAVQRESEAATPIFEITHMVVGNISSIQSQNWTSRFSFPDKALPAVLSGSRAQQDYSDPETPQAHWTTMSVHWDVDNSYTPERIAAMQAVTVGKAVEINSTAAEGTWLGKAATYTRYATFEVTATFQGRTVGPYTATFFFGKDSSGKEVVAPIDAIVGGSSQLLFNALEQTAYPSDILRSPKLRQSPVVDHWIQAHRSTACSSARTDLCCADGKCGLPESSVARDLAQSPTVHR